MKKLILILLFLVPAASASAEITQASYYTVKSAKHEGTSGIFTANGKRFDENKLTCASWDYPFGTKLKITSLKTKKSIEVFVTDRGPNKKLYNHGRKIDLTPLDFKSLGIPLADGLARVNVERIK